MTQQRRQYILKQNALKNKFPFLFIPDASPGLESGSRKFSCGAICWKRRDAARSLPGKEETSCRWTSFAQRRLWHQGNIQMQSACLKRDQVDPARKWPQFWGALRPKWTGIWCMGVRKTWGFPRRGGLIHFITQPPALPYSPVQRWKLKPYFPSVHMRRYKVQKSQCICSVEWNWFCWMEGILKDEEGDRN